MNVRFSLSVGLLCLGLIAALLPRRDNTAGYLSPSQSLKILENREYSISVDELARGIVDDDSTFQLIDLRSASEFRNFNIPGSVNIPLNELANTDYAGYFNQKGKKIILYSNGDTYSAQAWTILNEMGIHNCYTLSGGMNEWYKIVMLSEFAGETITPAENALFEVRYKARNLFTQMNSIPDSLKTKFKLAKKTEARQLVGGCL